MKNVQLNKVIQVRGGGGIKSSFCFVLTKQIMVG